MATIKEAPLNSRRNALLIWGFVGLISVTSLIGYTHHLVWDSQGLADHVLFAVQSVTFSGGLSDVTYSQDIRRLRDTQKLVVISSAILGALALTFWLATVAWYVIDYLSSPGRRQASIPP